MMIKLSKFSRELTPHLLDGGCGRGTFRRQHGVETAQGRWYQGREARSRRAHKSGRVRAYGSRHRLFYHGRVKAAMVPSCRSLCHARMHCMIYVSGSAKMKHALCCTISTHFNPLDNAHNCLKHHPAKMRGRQADGDIRDVCLLQRKPARRTRLALAKMLKGTRLAEKVAALSPKACAVRVLRHAQKR